MTQPVTDWDLYRKCPIDRAPTGKPCFSQSTRIVNGVPDGIRNILEHPHNARRVKSRKAHSVPWWVTA